MMYDHFNAIQRRLDHERARLAGATKPAEILWRRAIIGGIEKELRQEQAFLRARGFCEALTDDELLAELAGSAR